MNGNEQVGTPIRITTMKFGSETAQLEAEPLIFLFFHMPHNDLCALRDVALYTCSERIFGEHHGWGDCEAGLCRGERSRPR